MSKPTIDRYQFETGVYRPPGTASFVFRPHPTSRRFRLRRRLDAGFGGQRATIFLDGEPVGFFPAVDVNEDRRWREVDVDLRPLAAAPTELEISVVAEDGPPAGESTLDGFAAMANAAGFEVRKVWTDAEKLFSVQYCTRRG